MKRPGKNQPAALERLARVPRLSDAGREALRAALREPLGELHYGVAFVESAAAGPDVEQVAARLLQLAADLPGILEGAQTAAAVALREQAGTEVCRG